MRNENQVFLRLVEQSNSAGREIKERHEAIENRFETLSQVQRRMSGLDYGVEDLEFLPTALCLFGSCAELRVTPRQGLRHEIERTTQLSDLVSAFRWHPESEVTGRQLGGRRLKPPDPATRTSRHQHD